MEAATQTVSIQLISKQPAPNANTVFTQNLTTITHYTTVGQFIRKIDLKESRTLGAAVVKSLSFSHTIIVLSQRSINVLTTDFCLLNTCT